MVVPRTTTLAVVVGRLLGKNNININKLCIARKGLLLPRLNITFNQSL